MARRRAAARAASRAAARSGARIAPPAERNLIWALVHDVTDIEAVLEQIGPDDLTDSVAREIFTRLAAAAAEDSPAEIADGLSEAAAAAFAALRESELGEGFDRAKWIAGCVAQIRRGAIERRLAEIDGEMRLGSPDEQDALLEEKRRLTADRRALEPRKFKLF
ncbi:MAG: hypothetical protein IRY91_13630 [Gemmatimonadaceae bacterium]|nr:hypothetical protein [Gemmatimonadaceae bacterium]